MITPNSGIASFHAPDRSKLTVPMEAIIGAFAAHMTMSKQALDSDKVRAGLKDVLLGPGLLWESLRAVRETLAP